MDEKRILTMIVVSNILSAYYTAKNSFCIVNKREPDTKEKDEILKAVLRMFENLSTSYLDDIREIAESVK